MVPTTEALGSSDSFLDFQNRLSLAAKVNRSVLLIGERGAGKELAARRLHYLSGRWEGPFLTMNCAALTPSLIESELFGHEQGAFTGSKGTRKGRFEEADEGTLFLDEIGLIPMEVQEKILRVVEYGSFQRVGSNTTIEVDVRIIGATNANLPRLAEEGKFKKDLLDRLSFEVLYIPPLRCRGEDILLLAHHFAMSMAWELGRKETIAFTPEVEDELLEYHWPGNVRELKNVVERAIYRTKDSVISELVIDPFICPYDDGRREHTPQELSLELEPPELSEFRETIKNTEIQFIKKALELSDNNQRKAAELLELTYDQFRGFYKKYKDLL